VFVILAVAVVIGYLSWNSEGNITTGGEREVTPTSTTSTPTIKQNTPTITASPGSVSIPVTKNNCYPSYCTVFQNVIIMSSTSWTSTPPGFGSLREGFTVSPDSGPAGSTTVTITYRYMVAEHNDGFIRFRTTTIGKYVEVPVTVLVK